METNNANKQRIKHIYTNNNFKLINVLLSGSKRFFNSITKQEKKAFQGKINCQIASQTPTFRLRSLSFFVGVSVICTYLPNKMHLDIYLLYSKEVIFSF